MLFFTQNIQINVHSSVGLLGAHLCLGMVDRVVLDHMKSPNMKFSACNEFNRRLAKMLKMPEQRACSANAIPPSW